MSDEPIWDIIATEAGPSIYRVGVTIEMVDACRLPLAHGPIIYAILCEANAHASGGKPAMPDGILPDIVERSVTVLAPGDRYALGLTIIGGSGLQAKQRVDALVNGLRHVGRHPKSKSLTVKRFSVCGVEDLIRQTSLFAGGLDAVPHQAIVDQIDRVLSAGNATLDFAGPLRTQRPKSRKVDGHAYFDGDYFNGDILIRRLVGRLTALGYPEFQTATNVHVRTKENHLMWLDARYGHRQGKTLGGCVGSVTLEQFDGLDAWALVLGQLVHIGENTRFGFGRYWLRSSESSAWMCGRAEGLIDRCLRSEYVDRAAAKIELESGILSAGVRQIKHDQFQPDPSTRLRIPKTGGFRELTIPSRRDRGLQRLILDRMAPALEECWEQAAVAFRKGLGRHDAARRVQSAYRRGYRWAIKSDFSAFFDSVDHEALQNRLAAYVGDQRMVSLLMQFVKSAAPAAGRGLPTGAPISPLLSNLFLDRFDEQIDAAGGLLIRYADDFMILTRTQQQAEAMLLQARNEAEALQLELNRSKTNLLELSEGFAFLGFDFRKDQQWNWTGDDGPVLLEQLGWQPSQRKSSPPTPNDDKPLRLAGESDWGGSASETTAIWGPGVRELAFQGRRLVCTFDDARPTARLNPDHLRSIVVLGTPTIRGQALRTLARHDIQVWLCDDSVRVQQEVMPDRPLEDAEVVGRQVLVANDLQKRLVIARQLVAAKLSGYAHLAERLDPPNNGLARRLKTLAEQARGAERLEQLLGFEGAGGGMWYAAWTRWLPTTFPFPGRVAPGASDPVNACLNLAQTILHRYVTLAIRMSGMVPSIGLLHQNRSGHAALASDLQEPLRHLMDLAVIKGLRQVRANQFKTSDNPDYPLKMVGSCRGMLEKTIHQVLATPCAGRGQSEPAPYRLQALRMARSLRVHLLNPEKPFRPFQHPG